MGRARPGLPVRPPPSRDWEGVFKVLRMLHKKNWKRVFLYRTVHFSPLKHSWMLCRDAAGQLCKDQGSLFCLCQLCLLGRPPRLPGARWLHGTHTPAAVWVPWADGMVTGLPCRSGILWPHSLNLSSFVTEPRGLQHPVGLTAFLSTQQLGGPGSLPSRVVGAAVCQGARGLCPGGEEGPLARAVLWVEAVPHSRVLPQTDY